VERRFLTSADENASCTVRASVSSERSVSKEPVASERDVPFFNVARRAQPTMTEIVITQAELPEFPKLFKTSAAVPEEIVIVM
jgi:hypothetical protein